MAMEDYNQKKEELENQKAEAEATFDGEKIGDIERQLAELESTKSEFENLSEEVQTVPESQIAQVENMGGSTEELNEKTAEVDQEIAEQIQEVKNIEEGMVNTGNLEEQKQETVESSEGQIVENVEKAQSMEEVKVESAEFEKYNALSPEQKQYVDMVGKLKEAEVKKQEQYNEDRGFVYIGNEKISIDDFSKNPENFDKLDFSLINNNQNIDLLVGKIPSEKIYSKLESLGNDEKMIEKIDSMPLDAKNRFIESLPGNYRQNLNERYKNKIHPNISNQNPSISFQYSLRSINLPLVEKMGASREDYFNDLKKSRDNFLTHYKNEMEKSGPFGVSKIFEGSELKQLFRSTELKFIPKEKAIEMTRDVIKKYGEMNRTEMQPKIIEGVLALKREGIISEEEAEQILSIN